MTRRKKVLATGVFDILHHGHLRFLQESKKSGGPRARLVVVIARDKTVFNRKGHKPIMPERQRREIVAALKPVYRAILGHPNLDMLGVLEEVKPDVVCVGYDQQEIKASLNKLVRKEKLRLRVVQIPKFGQGPISSSSQLKARIAREWTLED